MVETYIDYPYVLHLLAKDMARDRIKGVHKYYKGKKYYHGDNVPKVNIQGVLAELIAFHYYIYNDKEFTAPSMYGLEPVVAADLTVEGCKIDVKYIPHYAKYLMVNYDAHHNPQKEVDAYLFVQPIKRLALGMAKAKLWYATHNEVHNWEVQKQTLTKVLCLSLKPTQN